MTRIRPSGLTLLAGTLLLLIPALAILQFRWVGQVSAAEQERMSRNLETAARQFRQAFDGEMLLAFQLLSVGPETARDEAWHRFATRRDEWVNQARAELVRNIYFVDENPRGGDLRVRRWDNDAVMFREIEWPNVLEPWQRDFHQELTDYRSGVPGRSASEAHFPVQPTLTIRAQGPMVSPPGPNGAVTVTQTFGYTVLELDVPFMQTQLLPELVARHFMHEEGDSYRIAVLDGESPRVLYRSQENAPATPEQADVVEGFFGRFQRTAGSGPPRGERQPDVRPATPATAKPDAAPDAAAARRGGDEFPGRWRLLVQHESGSLDAAVAGARWRNLTLSFGVLLLLSLSIALLTITSRRAQRLARQQMEFVASVSHELRTPVAVIKSAAENLSQGVVGNADRVKRYGQMIEGEARRLGEMVERVLQYAGIESGLGYGARTALAPQEIVQTAIDSAMPLLGPDTVTVHRDIPDNLPAVIGDAAALRSAVQNLVANAVKYGGADRWVGIKAEHVREQKGSEVRITVSDHGPGIPPNELPHIFEPFYRGGDALAQQIHGNGLGLSLVKRIIAAHDGRVTVATRAGAGTSFTITLPAAEPDASEAKVTGGMRAPVHP